MPAPDNSFLTLRRISIAAQRQEELYTALHIALIVVFAGVLYALFVIREDILKAIEGSKP